MTGPPDRGPPRRALGGVALSVALVPLGSTMIAVALVDVAHDLGVGVGASTWLVGGYLAAMVVAQPAGGRLGDVRGHRAVFITGMVLFLLLSAAAAAAPTFAVLVAVRVCQAAAGGLVLPNAQALVRATAPPDRVGRSMGVLSGALALAAAAGPPAGGLLAATLGWRAVFLAPLPAGLLALALCAGTPEGRRPVAAGPPRGGVAALAEPWRTSAFRRAAATILFQNLALYAALLAVPVVVSSRAGAGAGALVVAPLTLGLLAGALAGGRLADARGRRAPALWGSLVAMSGAAALTAAAVGAGAWAMALPLAVVGAGIGVSGPALQAASVEAGPGRLAAAAAGAWLAARYVGGIAATLVVALAVGAGATGVALAAAGLALAAAALAATGIPAGTPWRVLPGPRTRSPRHRWSAGTRPRAPDAIIAAGGAEGGRTR